MSKDSIDDMMLQLLGDAITHVGGIDRAKNRQRSDEQFDRLRELENEVFHFGLFSDLIEGDTKAEGKAILNNLMSKDPDKVNDTQLRLTPYIFYKSLILVLNEKINNAIENGRMVTRQQFELADVVAEKVSKVMLDTIKEMGNQIDEARKNK
jgi:hypothetical protein